MTAASLVALEDRERIDALNDRKRTLDFLQDVPEAVWGKEGPEHAKREWEAAVRHDPFIGEGVSAGGLDDRERMIVAELLRKLNPQCEREVKVS